MYWIEEKEIPHLVSISNVPSNDPSLLDDPDELREGLRDDGAGEHPSAAQKHVVGVVRDLQ